MIDPNKVQKFTEHLQTIFQQKLHAKGNALVKATTVSGYFKLNLCMAHLGIYN